ncbi:MAG: hypothetical protein L6306_12135 [Planctomycetales bacterium]|nr:hypothetical protein [Planctomycetales bacterium]
MKTFVRHAVALVAITVLCQAGFALADDYYWVDGGNRSAKLVGDEKVADQGQSCITGDPASCCPEPTCGSCCGPFLGCDECPCRGVVGFFGFDSFKGVSDSFLGSNFGAVAGLNSAIGAFGLADYGIGWQLGMSYGVYDWNGSAGVRPTDNQQQVFVTTGFFRKAAGDQQLSFGLVYDWMINDNWGIWGVNPTMGQWRGQVEWAVSGSNAFGIYGCLRDLFSVQNYTGGQVPIIVRNQSLTQVNLFWHHKFVSGADSWLWVGAPENVRLNQLGSLGDLIVGANIQVPITDRLALYGNAQYMNPSATAGLVASTEEAWNIGAGIVWYFGGHARSDKINGKCWLPYLPVANNSTFLVDQGVTLRNLD